MLSHDEFQQEAGRYSENAEHMFRGFVGRDAQISPWEWIMEASPYVNADDGDTRENAWARTILYYNAWAGSVGRPVVTVQDLARGGLGEPLLTQACEAVLTFPAPQWAMTSDELSHQSESRLRVSLGTYQAQVIAAGVLEANGTRPPGFSSVLEASVQANEVAISAELEKRGRRS